LGQVAAAIGPHTGIYMGLTATRSRHSVVVPVAISIVSLKMSCGRHDVVKLVAVDLKTNGFGYFNTGGGPKYEI